MWSLPARNSQHRLKRDEDGETGSLIRALWSSLPVHNARKPPLSANMHLGHALYITVTMKEEGDLARDSRCARA